MFRFLLAVAPCFMLAGCANSCANTVVSRKSSPDGQHEAVMFQRDCGATTGFSTQISILDAGEQLSESGNTFRADDGQGAARVGDWGGTWVEMNWLSSEHLLIRYATKSRLFEQDEDVSGVRITYEEVGA
jgi:hypothetical protein